jgi:hypothetical protein
MLSGTVFEMALPVLVLLLAGDGNFYLDVILSLMALHVFKVFKIVMIDGNSISFCSRLDCFGWF